MLGSKLGNLFKSRDHDVVAPRHEDVDLLYPHILEGFFRSTSFDVLVNCAAFTRVDACEEPAKFSMALNTNGTSVGWLAKFCRKSGRTLVHFSTDYVFDGRKEEPYVETDPTGPLNVYGRTKLQGEKLVLMEQAPAYLVRTSWVYGPGGDHFVKRIASLMKARTRLEVVSDQVGGPTYTGDLGQFVLDLLERRSPYGLYHFANAGHVSWHGFAKEIQAQLGLNGCDLVPTRSDKIFRPAERPANSRFDLAKAEGALGHPVRSWQEALKEYLTKEFPSEAA